LYGTTLRHVSRFYVEYVSKATPPPPRFFEGTSEHTWLVRRTRAIARNATLWMDVPHHRLPGEAYDEHPFVSVAEGAGGG
jgi:hypothetical protein